MSERERLNPYAMSSRLRYIANHTEDKQASEHLHWAADYVHEKAEEQADAAARERELVDRLDLTQRRLDECMRHLSDCNIGGALSISELSKQIKALREVERLARRVSREVENLDGDFAAVNMNPLWSATEDLDKAIAATERVRFMEAENAPEVGDFNIYTSPLPGRTPSADDVRGIMRDENAEQDERVRLQRASQDVSTIVQAFARSGVEIIEKKPGDPEPAEQGGRVMDLTEAESRTLDDTGRVAVVRPMEDQIYLTVSRSESHITGLWVGTIEEDGRFGFVTFEGPTPLGDTLSGAYPMGAHTRGNFVVDGTVKSVRAIRFDGLDLNVMYCGFSHGSEFLRYWNETYGHRHDWRYEANPWCWVVEVET